MIKLSFKLALNLGLFSLMMLPIVAVAQPTGWQWEWPNTDFTQSSIDFSEILEGGPAKDGIPALDHPRFRAVPLVTDLGANEPVISLVIGGQANAYPLRIMSPSPISLRATVRRAEAGRALDLGPRAYAWRGTLVNFQIASAMPPFCS